MIAKTRPLLATLTGSLLFLTACGSSPPPGDEFAKEVIEQQAPTDEVKACMNDVVDNFALTDDEKALNVGDNLDDVAAKAAEGNEAAKGIIDRFQAELTACN